MARLLGSDTTLSRWQSSPGQHKSGAQFSQLIDSLESQAEAVQHELIALRRSVQSTATRLEGVTAETCMVGDMQAAQTQARQLTGAIKKDAEELHKQGQRSAAREQALQEAHAEVGGLINGEDTIEVRQAEARSSVIALPQPLHQEEARHGGTQEQLSTECMNRQRAELAVQAARHEAARAAQESAQLAQDNERLERELTMANEAATEARSLTAKLAAELEEAKEQVSVLGTRVRDEEAAQAVIRDSWSAERKQ